MNQQCKVCGEPAAGFHFGAFTCEGCKSFFGRSYNNLGSMSECKNNGTCVINKKNRTTCKSCRLRKCILVGMSKSGSRYGRRSNWFKIHCLLQDQHQQHMATVETSESKVAPPIQQPPYLGLDFLNSESLARTIMKEKKRNEELMLLDVDEYKHSAASPLVNSPESRHSDSSTDISEMGHSLPFFPGLIPAALLPPTSFLFHPSFAGMNAGLLQPDYRAKMALNGPEIKYYKNHLIDSMAVRQSDHFRLKTDSSTSSAIQANPIDLSIRAASGISIRAASDRSATPSDVASSAATTEDTELSSVESEKSAADPLARLAPLDLTNKV